MREFQGTAHPSFPPRTAARMGLGSNPDHCRAAFGGLPTRYVVTKEGPHLRPSWRQRGGVGAALSSPAVPPTCPEQQSTAVTKGQHRSTGEVADLRHRRTASSAAVLPKLAVEAQPQIALYSMVRASVRSYTNGSALTTSAAVTRLSSPNSTRTNSRAV
jgi:hypothetical protein